MLSLQEDLGQLVLIIFKKPMAGEPNSLGPVDQITCEQPQHIKLHACGSCCFGIAPEPRDLMPLLLASPSFTLPLLFPYPTFSHQGQLKHLNFGSR